MKVLTNKIGKKKIILVLSWVLITCALLNAVGYICDIEAISVIAVYRERDKYEVISELLIESLDYIGACNPKDTANVWAEGLRKRSGAMQASVMTKELREKYIQRLSKNFPNWVTGMSSPWIEKYDIVEINEANEMYKVKLKFDTVTSTGPFETYYATLKVKKEDRILENL
jgi:hypothetical protein